MSLSLARDCGKCCIICARASVGSLLTFSAVIFISQGGKACIVLQIIDHIPFLFIFIITSSICLYHGVLYFVYILMLLLFYTDML